MNDSVNKTKNSKKKTNSANSAATERNDYRVLPVFFFARLNAKEVVDYCLRVF